MRSAELMVQRNITGFGLFKSLFETCQDASLLKMYARMRNAKMNNDMDEK